MEYLDAINEVTSTVGTLPVSSVDIGHPDVNIAKAKLNIVHTRFQTMGYWFNKVTDVDHIRDTTGFIYIEPSVMDIEMSSTYVIRGGKIYDIVNKTFVFTEDLILNTIYKIDFDLLQDVVALAITAQAAYEFFRQVDGDPAQTQALANDARIAHIRVKQENLKHTLPTAHSQTMASKLLRGNPQS